jgi:cardiolipin synthase
MIQNQIAIRKKETTQLQLIRSGREYFDLLEKLIDDAKHTIHLQTYIFDFDDTGKSMLHCLTNAAQRGVNILLIVDGYASQDLPLHVIAHIKNSGIRFHFFNRLLRSKYFYFGRRLHHKVTVVDGEHALVGGINISDHYNDTVEHLAWLDFALYLHGTKAKDLERVCDHMAKFEVMESIKSRLRIRRKYDGTQTQQIEIKINDWVRGKREITNTYVKMLRQAQSQVTIMSSYLLPGGIIRSQLKKASKRGVKIRLIMTGISDVPIAKHAERYMYSFLLRNNIEIYEYQKNILHAKMAVCDGQFLTIGSYNVNNISAYASVELNLDVLDPVFVSHVDNQLNQIIKNNCKQITREEYKHKHDLFNQFLQRSAYDIFRIVLFLFTFYFKQKE